ncbi:MAG: DNA-binding response regulator [Deltaproteobacteria bacterium RBG_16_48_10]|nr:MAG: DNA-binding response regulator [Deltaproteobacteria bacterium RBG_16_48_10]
MTVKKVLVVDDEPKITQVVSAYLEKEGYQVFTASSGKEALELNERKVPDLIILDLRLPDLPGEEVCKRVRQRRDTPILMLTAKAGEEDKVQGLAIGADDYLTKPFSPRELVARVRAILRRAKAEKEPQRDIISFDKGKLRLDVPKLEVFLNGGALALTPNEFKLLLALARYPGRVYTRSELINKVQGYEYEGYDRTIDAHIKNLRQKIEKDPKNPEYILTVFGVGYKFGGEEDGKTSLD